MFDNNSNLQKYPSLDHDQQRTDHYFEQNNNKSDDGDQYQTQVGEVMELKREPPAIESLMQEQGGVGRVQIMVFLITWFQLASGNWLNYQFNFLLKYPIFRCERDGTIIEKGSDDYDMYCKPAYFCENADVKY